MFGLLSGSQHNTAGRGLLDTQLSYYDFKSDEHTTHAVNNNQEVARLITDIVALVHQSIPAADGMHMRIVSRCEAVCGCNDRLQAVRIASQFPVFAQSRDDEKSQIVSVSPLGLFV